MSSRPLRPDTRETNRQAGLAFAVDGSNCAGLVSELLTIRVCGAHDLCPGVPEHCSENRRAGRSGFMALGP